jgi:hypothetical protein
MIFAIVRSFALNAERGTAGPDQRPGPAVREITRTAPGEETRNLRRLDIARSRRPTLRRRRPNHPHGGGHARWPKVRERTLFIKYIDNIDKSKSNFDDLRRGCSRACPRLSMQTPGCSHRSYQLLIVRRRPKRRCYQACWVRQCGQATVVETGARKLKPHSQTYAASSSGPPALRTRSTAGSPARRLTGATTIGAGGVRRGCSARVRLRSRRVWGRLARMALCEKTLPTAKGFALQRGFPGTRAVRTVPQALSAGGTAGKWVWNTEWR